MCKRKNCNPVWFCLTILIFFCAGCGGNPDGPSGLTQARVESNNEWHLLVDGQQIANGMGTVGTLITLGSGQRCATGLLKFTRLPAPASNVLRLWVGQNMQETTVNNGQITVCGSGPAAKQRPMG